MQSDASESLGDIRPFFRIRRLMEKCNMVKYMHEETQEGNA